MWRASSLLAGRSMGLAAAAFVGTVAACEVSSDQVDHVQFTDRPKEKWIEVEQRRRADKVAQNQPFEYSTALRTLRAAYSLPIESMRSLQSHFIAEAKAGLSGQPSSMRMLPTFVNKRVTGTEKGDYYALDLGGTNFRVLKLTLEGAGKVGPVTQAKFKIPDEIKKGTGKGLFGFLADSVAMFLATECNGNPNGDLGFTFSFPTEQTAIDSGTLITWNKDFAASGVIGNDVVALLQSELSDRGINMRVRALANDTVGTMEAAAYRFPDTAMGVILGTGTNAAYLEKTSNVPKWKGAPCEEMVINTEWGNLGMGRLMNKYDTAVDAASDNPGAQQLEKMISGMYLGELTRVTLKEPAVRNALSPACASEMAQVFEPKLSLPTSSMAAIEADTSPMLTEVEIVLKAAGVNSATLADRVLIREACVCVSTRAALLSAVGISSLLELTRHDADCKVAVDGTVFECYPFFKERMEGGLEIILGKERAQSIDLILAKDGSGVGAAIIAAVAHG